MAGEDLEIPTGYLLALLSWVLAGSCRPLEDGIAGALSYKKSVIYVYLFRKSRISANERISVTYLRIVRVLLYGFRPMDVFQQCVYKFYVFCFTDFCQ